MDRLTRLVLCLATLFALLGSCTPKKSSPVPEAAPLPPPVSAEQGLFPSPYFPARDRLIDGRPVAELAAGWVGACLYREDLLDDAQKAWVATLEPAGGEGRVAPGFTQDFDGDGRTERVAYGAYAKEGGEEGNFVLVTREAASGVQVVLLRELAGPPQFTVFTLKPDGSLWFGGGIDAGEVTMRLTWVDGSPVFNFLTEE